MTFKKLTPNMVVHDVNATIDFYRDTLGFAVAASVPESGMFNWAMLTAGDITIMVQSLSSVHEAEDLPWFKLPEGNDGAIFYIDVDDVQELRDSVEGKAQMIVEMHTTFYGTMEFSILDPNGYILSFAQDGA
ncbi:MAG: VOC family protein [Bacteroidetes bacterium]|nr:VOC family protein [Bacteroidota bacterium]